MSSVPSPQPDVAAGETASETPRRESRRAPRHQIVRFVWYSVLSLGDEPRDPALEGVCRTVDISLTGLGLYLVQPIPEGMTVFVELALGVCNISAVGRTVHVVQQPDGLYRVGIKFSVIPPNHQLQLETLLSPPNESEG